MTRHAMPRRRPVYLQFNPALDAIGRGARLSQALSAVVSIANTLWVCHDETVSVERLSRAGIDPRGAPRFARHLQFPLAGFLALPIAPEDGERTPEGDVEGLAYADGYLWLVGSHAVRRGDMHGTSAAAKLAAMAATSRAGNRHLLARIPVGERHGETVLRRRVEHPTPDDAASARTAARLPGNAKGNLLTAALAEDAHLAQFMSIPGKDNGFDIEGLAAAPGGRLFVGVRAPTLNGWACLLEIEVGTHRKHDDRLTLRPINPGNPANPRCPSYCKHLLDLRGGGVRDLCLVGRDLLILTGPPMRGDGYSRVVRWRNALASRTERVVPSDRLETLLTLPYHHGHDHAEGLTVLPPQPDGRLRVLVVYDSASSVRQLPGGGLVADMFTFS